MPSVLRILNLVVVETSLFVRRKSSSGQLETWVDMQVAAAAMIGSAIGAGR